MEKPITFDNANFNNVDCGGYDKSLVKGQFPTGCADPYIFRYDGRYYLYVTTSGLNNYGLRAWKSDDLIHWEPCQGKGLKEGYVVDHEDKDGTYTQNAYAPEVYYINGKFYMIISPGPEAVSPKRGHRILVADTPEGPFYPHSGQIDTRIDGSLLIDDDESIYFAHATPKGITIHEIKDMKELGEGAIIPASDGTGAWTEGPGFTKVRGQYFLTYTGCHYQTPGYQVLYAVASHLDKSSIQAVAASFHRGPGRTVLLNCDKDEGHVGLGHSINFLGPDLDSYYICYHSLDALYPDGMTHRSFNIDRLLVGPGFLTSANNTRGTIYPKWPFYQTRGEKELDTIGEFLLSKASSHARYSVEWNIKGKGDLVFAFADEKNYAYVKLDFEGHRIEVREVANGVESLLGEGKLKNAYSYENNQTIRLAYDGALNVYFNNLRKISITCRLGAGKVGYRGKSLTIGYTAISDEANGSSDRNEWKQALGEIPATAHLGEKRIAFKTEQTAGEYSGVREIRLNKGEAIAYSVYFQKDGDYGVEFALDKRYLGTDLQIAIDGKPAALSLPNPFPCEDQVVKVFTEGVTVSAGPHIVSFAPNSKFAFVSFKFLPKSIPFSLENDLTSSVEGFRFETNGYASPSENGLTVEGRRDFVALSHQFVRDVSFSCDVCLQSLTQDNGFAGIVVRQNNYAYSDVPKQDFKDAFTHLQGYILELRENKIVLLKSNFGDVKSYVMGEKEIDAPLGSFQKLTLEAKGNTLIAGVNGTPLIEVSDPMIFQEGAIGLYSYRCKAVYKNSIAKKRGSL